MGIRIDETFLKSKVARRIFALFILCALIPLVAISVISFTQVSKQLESQSRLRLRRSSKSIGMSVMERLLFLETQLKVLSSGMDEIRGSSAPLPSHAGIEGLKGRFLTLALQTHSGELVTLFGDPKESIRLSDAQREHLRSGKALITTEYENGNRNTLCVFMISPVDPEDLAKGLIHAEIDSMYLWGLLESDSLPGLTELCVMDESQNVIFSSHPVSPSFHKTLINKASRYFSEQFEWDYQGREFLGCFWPIFLQYQFFEPKWTVITSTAKDDIFAPLAYFKKIFPLFILLSLLVVLLLSVIQIRKTMTPLEKLKEGTRRIAMRDFETRVTVTSGDEFEELGSSFNHMARQLGRQFNALTTMADIDRAILSSLDTEEIIRTVISTMHKVCNYDLVSVFLFDLQSKDRCMARMYSGHGASNHSCKDVEIRQDDLEMLTELRETLTLKTKEEVPGFLKSFKDRGIESAILLPLFISQRPAGIIALGTFEVHEPSDEDLLQVRQLADQVAVALSNAHLIEELDKLNWGALKALARTVDAKSPWTAGHSERVTEMALKLGKVMGLSEKELQDLHRGGLLHDIGKIGVPAEILDKPGRLTDEEFAIIKQHPLTGARILEPIAAYADIIPMGEQHHERFDGKGYPYGISGEDICLGARILSVADVYDALISDRPYREGMGKERTLQIIKEGSGTQFDEQVVNALLKVVEEEKTGQDTDKKTRMVQRRRPKPQRGVELAVKSP
ncbi:MAG: HD domain-containing phosphohydrolase [bacterium]